MSRDTVVIGAGHNGLVAAGYLARAGRDVLVLERRHDVGGAAVTEEIAPGVRVSALADGAPRLHPRVIRDLHLARHGLRLRRTDPLVLSPQAGDGHLVIWRDEQRTADGLAARSRRDAERYPRFSEMVRSLAGLLAGVMESPVPDLFGLLATRPAVL
jgi:phytoene dehydrogenase-like protein